MKKAWYLGCSREQVADRVILVGDPGRIPRLGKHLEDVQHLPVNRGLATATGSYEGIPVTLAAFGMGAPIAAIVLHELADLGSRLFLRIGTSIGLPPVEIGDVVIARDAVRHEGTSNAYAEEGSIATADRKLATALADAAKDRANRCHIGTFASYDGFYRDMFALDEETSVRVAGNFQSLEKQNVLAVDMETSAILTVGSVLGCKTGSLCLSTVNSLTRQKLNSEQQIDGEKLLMSIALRALTGGVRAPGGL